MYYAHVGLIVLHADVLEHPERDHVVERLGGVERTVVLQADLDREALQPLTGVRDLLLRDRHADAARAVAFGGVGEEAPPPAANVEHAVARLQAELAADEVELGLLHRVKGVGLGPVAARVDQAAVEHGLEEVVAEVVVALPDLERLRRARLVDEALRERAQEHAGAADRTPNGGPDVRAEEAVERLVEALGIPPPVHVALAEAERAVADDAFVEPVVVDLDVPRVRAVDGEPRVVRQLEDDAVGGRGTGVVKWTRAFRGPFRRGRSLRGRVPGRPCRLYAGAPCIADRRSSGPVRGVDVRDRLHEGLAGSVGEG